jgi:GAF domain-containing protein
MGAMTVDPRTRVAAVRADLLQAIAEVALRAFDAHAVSVARVDDGARDLVFEAVAGEGREELVGARFRRGEGLAGIVAETGAPIVADDVDRDPRWAHDVAQETGYVPTTLMIVPIVRDGRTAGVLSVLDRESAAREEEDLELLEWFAAHAALVLR